MKANISIAVVLVTILSMGAVGPSVAAAPVQARAAAAPLRAAPAVYDCTLATGILLADCQALVALYDSTGGLGWTTQTGWLTSTTPCADWVGVTCTGNRVTELSLSANNLAGTIPVDVYNLSELQILDLSANSSLIGTIPPELGSLAQLGQLHLNSDGLTGPIPTTFASLANLQVLDLSYNQLTGSIPPGLGGLTNLIMLNVTSNQLSGTVPVQLGTLNSLQLLGLASNPLTGPIPVELGNLSAAQQIDLSGTQLSGPVPAQFGTISGLLYLYLQADATVNRGLPQSLKATAPAYFWFDQTGLCEPPDTAFQAWLGTIPFLQRTGVACAAVASTVTISGSGANVVLNWIDQSPNTGYEVHRSTTPYFTVAAGNQIGTLLAQPTSTATDTGALGAPGYYYIVRSKFTDSANDFSADSNQTGEFTFPLVPGG